MRKHILHIIAGLTAACVTAASVVPFAYAQQSWQPLDIDEAGSTVEQSLALYQDMHPAGEAQYNCYTFAQDVLEYIFGVRPQGIDYHGNSVSGSNLTVIGRYADDTACGAIEGEVDGALDADNLMQLFSKAATGDIAQGIGEGERQHTMVLQSADEEGIVVYHGNYLGAIAVTRYTYEDLIHSYGHVITLYRASNYNEINKMIEKINPETAESYIVTFDANGGVPQSQTKKVTNGGIYGKMPKPTFEGYTFEGWFTAPDGGEKISGATAVTLNADVTLYAHWEKNASKFARMPDGKIGIVVAGEYLNCSLEPIIQNDRTLVPVRDVFTALGARINWDDSTKTIEAVKDDRNIIIRMGDSEMIMNGEEIELDVPAQIINDSAFLPVRAVSEALGADVVWSDSLRTIFINTYDF